MEGSLHRVVFGYQPNSALPVVLSAKLVSEPKGPMYTILRSECESVVVGSFYHFAADALLKLG